MKKNIDPNIHGRNRNQKQPPEVEAQVVFPVTCGTSATIEGKAKSEKGNNRSAGKGLEPNSTQQNEKKIVKTAVQYVRSATDSPESIRDQLKQTAKYAAENGYKIVGESFVDNGFSGLETKNRPAFMRMLNEIQNGEASYRYVLMVDVSRLGRFANAYVAEHYEDLCNNKGVTIVYTHGGSEIHSSISEEFFRGFRRATATDPQLTPLSSQDQSR